MEMRIDKWLWTVRVFKTRSKATEFCKKGRVFIDGRVVKASRLVTPGLVIQVKRPPITYGYKIIKLTHGRVGPKLVPDFMKEVTSAEQLELLECLRLDQKSGQRPKGTGRPTKKERRSVDAFQDDVPYFFEEEYAETEETAWQDEERWPKGTTEPDMTSKTVHKSQKKRAPKGAQEDRNSGHGLKEDHDWDDFA